MHRHRRRERVGQMEYALRGQCEDRQDDCEIHGPGDARYFVRQSSSRMGFSLLTLMCLV